MAFDFFLNIDFHDIANDSIQMFFLVLELFADWCG